MNMQIIRAALNELELGASALSTAYDALRAIVPADHHADTDRAPAAKRTGPAGHVAPQSSTPQSSTPQSSTPQSSTPRTTTPAPRVVPPLDIAPPRVTPRQSPAGKTKDAQVLGLVAAAHGLMATEIAAKTNDTVPTIYSRLQRLVKEGVLTVGTDKKYRRVVVQDTPAERVQ